MTTDPTDAIPTKPCRYCGEAPHVPADACLTTAQKAGRIIGVLLLIGIGIFVVGMIFVAVSLY